MTFEEWNKKTNAVEWLPCGTPQLNLTAENIWHAAEKATEQRVVEDVIKTIYRIGYDGDERPAERIEEELKQKYGIKE